MQGPQHEQVTRACGANRRALQEASLRYALTCGTSALGGDSAAIAAEVCEKGGVPLERHSLLEFCFLGLSWG